MTRRVVVVGGGVSGLATAYRLTRRDPSLDVVVLEAANRPGGKLRSIQVGDLVLPAGPDAFLARKPWAVDLCKELGLGNELVAPSGSGSFLWTDQGLVRFLPESAFGIPGDVGDVLRWPGLSPRGRARALRDLLAKQRRDPGDETLGSLLRRRLGDEATERIVGPLLAGLFAGDVDRLSVLATFPELAEWEAWQGSLIRGAQATRRRARQSESGPMFLKPRGGVERLTDTLAERLGSRVRSDSPAEAIGMHDAGWRVRTASGHAHAADAVVLAVGAHGARQLLDPVSHAAAEELEGIPEVSTAVVLLVYPEGTKELLPDGTGFVVPRDRAPMTASTWLSNKWPSESFGSRAVVRCYVGSAGADDVVEAADTDLIDACARHMAAVVPLPEQAADASVVRWPKSMPQYELGHIERVERVREHLPAGIFVTGQAYGGTGVPDCVRAAGETADAVLDDLATEAPSASDRNEETVR